MEANDLDYKPLSTILKVYTEKGRPESRSFLNWFLENIYRLDDIQADDSICDAPNDKGVDGIYVDETFQEIHIFQTKIRQKSDPRLGDSDLQKFAGALSQFETSDKVDKLLEGGANED